MTSTLRRILQRPLYLLRWLNSKHQILPTAAIVAALLVISLIVYGVFFQMDVSSNPAQIQVTGSELSQSMNGTIYSVLTVRNIGSEEFHVSGQLDGFFLPPYTFDSTNIAPGDSSVGASTAKWAGSNFDGQSGYIEVQDTSSINPNFFTLEIAFRYNGLNPDQQMIVGKGAAGQNSFYFYTYRTTNNINDFVIYSNGIRHDHSLGDIFSAGRWYHVAFTIDGTNVAAYIDGRLSNQWVDPVTFQGNPLNLTIGKCTCGGYYFNGSIAFLRLYNRALSQQEVTENFHNSLSPTSLGLVMWLSSNSASGNTIDDISGLGNKGTIFSGVTITPISIPCGTYSVILTATASDGKSYTFSRRVLLSC